MDDDDNNTWSFSRKFTSEFRSAQNDLEERLNNAKTSPTPEVIQNLSVDLAKLAKSLVDAVGSLPSYDLKLYETQVNDLEKRLNELRISAAPKQRFTFKRKAAPATSSPATPPPLALTGANENAMSTPSLPSTDSSVSLHSYTYLTVHSLTRPLQSSLTISNLDHCILNLLPVAGQPPLNLSAVHISNIKNSVLLLPIINGSIMAHNLSRCVIAVGCHQFRMHTSAKVDVFLSISSNPIIENSIGIRFAAYPEEFSELGGSETVAETVLAVQDFSHIRSSPSPHWIHMDQMATSRPWPTEFLPSRAEIESSLQHILPPG